ncbi:HD domain-containing phosphohydrolase [Terasakiella pusilla]|uniref:HD domain-containing phosphohydrolase n=1 Tax=Terasakiella pusilla TaxID=64973 RepID=UPI003AA84C1C
MSTETILVVDDEVQNLALIRQIIGKDYTLKFAKNGEEAITAVKRFNPQLILLDIQLPDMDGYEICRQLNESNILENTSVIFVTSRSAISAQAEGFQVGAIDYMIKPIVPEILKYRVKTHLNLVRKKALETSYHDAIRMLSEAGHYNDTDTGNHIWRMARYAKTLGQHIGLDENTCALIEMAAPMHDTGKIGIPDSILKKPGKLDAQEWETMQKHCLIGYEILSKSQAPIFKLAAQIAYYHHEKWDGTGYPLGLKGNDIPLEVQVVAIADVFDALATKRPYKEAWSTEDAFPYMLSESGKHFNPDLIQAFCDIRPLIERIQQQFKDGD